MNDGPAHGGYILLISILIIGVIATEVVSSLLLLGTSANKSSFSLQQSAEALAIAEGCSEYTLQKLHDSLGYSGTETVTMGLGSCDITTNGVGNTNRTICVEARVGEVVRRLEIIVQHVVPQTKIYSWREVSVFSLCS